MRYLLHLHLHAGWHINGTPLMWIWLRLAGPGAP